MLKEFKDFVMRGNVLDLAVAVIIGGAFGKIVASLVNDVIMPFIGILMGGISFTSLEATVGTAVVKYGIFIQTIVDRPLGRLWSSMAYSSKPLWIFSSWRLWCSSSSRPPTR